MTTANIRIAPNATNGQTGTINVGDGIGTSTLSQNSDATLVVGATLGGPTPNSGTLNINSGGVFNSSGGTGTITINKTGTVNVVLGTLNAKGNVLVDGGKLIRGSSGAFILSAGKTVTVTGGGRASFTGGYATETNAIYNVSGANSKLETIAGTLSVAHSAAGERDFRRIGLNRHHEHWLRQQRNALGRWRRFLSRHR